MRLISTVLAIVLACATTAAPAFAWGATGHRLISAVAVEKLPPSVPAFVRSADAIAEIGALGQEADRLKSSGPPWNDDYDPAHFVDVDDDGRIGGAVALAQLPPTREGYDTALRAANTDQYKMGYLPYEIIDGWQQIVTDFGYWRADSIGETSAATEADRAFFAFDRKLREVLTLRDIGYWSHFVGDASQPLHVSVHYNGWGTYPNPADFSNSRTIHARFEGSFVRAAATEPALARRVRPYAPSSDPIAPRVAAYLRATLDGVPAVYRLEAAHGIDARSPAAVDFMLDRLAAGASMLRDLIADAWDASARTRIGYPAISVNDVETGKITLRRSTFVGD